MKIGVILLIVFILASYSGASQPNGKGAESGKSSQDGQNGKIPYEKIVLALSSLVGLIGATYQISLIRNSSSVKKIRLKNDIEILEKLERDSESYHSVKARIDKSVRELYSVRQKNKIIQSYGDFLFGIFILLVAISWSWYLWQKEHAFSWWFLMILPIAFVGLGGILNGFEKKEDNKI
jgi:hypothetical protein